MIHRFQRKTHSLHQTASGMSFEIDIWEYSPHGATRCIYLQGGLHGVELTGIPVLMRFMKELEESQYPERIICVPWSNPMGLDSQIMGQQTGYNNLHTNQQNCWNWNRITHLKDEGSLEGRWISTLLELSEEADTVLDLHTAGYETIPHVYVHHSQKELALDLGIPHLLAWDKPSSSFSDTCFQRGQKALTFELSSSRTIIESSITFGLEVLRCFFGFSKSINKTQVWNQETQMLKWYSPESGVICWHKNSGDMVSQKDPILTMFSRQGEKVFQSPYDGILLLKNPIHAPHQYQELAKFLVP